MPDNEDRNSPLLTPEEKKKQHHREASKRHYDKNPAIKEKKRIAMAEKRAAIKAARRRWDPPKKPKESPRDGPNEATVPVPTEDHHLFSSGDERNTHSLNSDRAPRLADPVPMRAHRGHDAHVSARTVRVHRAPERVEHDLASIMAFSPTPDDEDRDPTWFSGNEEKNSTWLRAEEKKKQRHREASKRHYARNPAIKEKKRIAMAEKRAAIKAARRRWDPPKKPKKAPRVDPNEGIFPTEDHNLLSGDERNTYELTFDDLCAQYEYEMGILRKATYMPTEGATDYPDDKPPDEEPDGIVVDDESFQNVPRRWSRKFSAMAGFRDPTAGGSLWARG
ncbi:hypothetical protein DFH09DRAFT_1192138 [Mycena vulgaris]|nr:hypothetical protein DFH09DRAFT_1192138 [Mycena vulgaris]